ncbi:DNA-binding domain-containing protein, AraC-type [Opitutaceae bacterium TAV1]|nr:DNA-binding domain-containing protein, AraC-type [Opitutaceae bacterium TAV1]
MASDPVSDILRLADAQPIVVGGFTAGGAWALRFPPPDKIKFFALVKGNCWLRRDGDAEAVRIEQGDVVVLSAARPFVLASDLAATPLDAVQVFAGKVPAVAHVGKGEDVIQIGGHLVLDPLNGAALTSVLPDLIHIRAASPRAAVLRWLLDQLVLEGAAHLPGAELASAQLARLMFIQVLRIYLSSPEVASAGILRALGDPKISAAIRLMHGSPDRAWNLGSLAKAVGMSRTRFAEHFKEMAGTTPLAYLTGWRMRLARQALRKGTTPVALVARSLGYQSESAFSHAFKRVTGISPKRYGTRPEADGETLLTLSRKIATG